MRFADGGFDVKAATDERGLSVRQRRVVLTPRCWRQVREKQEILRDVTEAK